MTRGELFDTICDAVYESVFKIVDEDPYGDGELIDWDEDVLDHEISLKVDIDIKPVQKKPIRCSVRRYKVMAK